MQPKGKHVKFNEKLRFAYVFDGSLMFVDEDYGANDSWSGQGLDAGAMQSLRKIENEPLLLKSILKGSQQQTQQLTTHHTTTKTKQLQHPKLQIPKACQKAKQASPQVEPAHKPSAGRGRGRTSNQHN